MLKCVTEDYPLEYPKSMYNTQYSLSTTSRIFWRVERREKKFFRILLACGNHAEFLVTFSFVTNLRFPKDRIKNELNVWVIL